MTNLILYSSTRPLYLFGNGLRLSTFLNNNLKYLPNIIQKSEIHSIKSNNNTPKIISDYILSKNLINMAQKRLSSNEKKAIDEVLKSVEKESNASSKASAQAPKKVSKFKALYTQYGPLFVVVHLTTVVLWIYGFFLLSKQ
jgi:hypothetical protein